MGTCSYMKITNITNEIKNAIWHDFHKLKGAKHTDDKKLSTKADSDASKMSRPVKFKKPFYDENVNNYRLLLIDNRSMFEYGQGKRNELCSGIRRRYIIEQGAELMYNKLICCNYLSKFNESPDLPYTSLKYHTILTTNLHYNYLNGKTLGDLCMKIININDINIIFDVIFKDVENNKCIVICDKNSYKDYDIYSNIGNFPSTNFGNVWSRMNGTVYFDDILLSNLRRLKSWSVGLQYMEDVMKLENDNKIDI